MRAGSYLLLCLLCQLLAVGVLGRRSDVVDLTEANFDELTRNGTWLIKVYAPWCSHCQHLEPTWFALATELKQSGVKVGRINGDKHRNLLRRFAVQGYPSIYLIKGWSTWVYQSTRQHSKIKDFALGGYKSTKPVALWRSPSSPIGRLSGHLHRLPSHAQQLYKRLKSEGYSDLAIVGSALVIPVVIGAVCICALDAAVTRRQQHAHYD